MIEYIVYSTDRTSGKTGTCLSSELRNHDPRVQRPALWAKQEAAKVVNVLRSDLLESKTKGLVAMNSDRRDSAMHRVMSGRSDSTIIMCLGHGRCMFPIDGDDDGKRVCPFCMLYDEKRAHTDGHAFKTAQQFVKGH